MVPQKTWRATETRTSGVWMPQNSKPMWCAATLASVVTSTTTLLTTLAANQSDQGRRLTDLEKR